MPPKCIHYADVHEALPQKPDEPVLLAGQFKRLGFEIFKLAIPTVWKKDSAIEFLNQREDDLVVDRLGVLLFKMRINHDFIDRALIDREGNLVATSLLHLSSLSLLASKSKS